MLPSWTKVRATFFAKTISRYARATPPQLLVENFHTDKTGTHFKLYTRLVCGYIEMLRHLQAETPQFVENVQLFKAKEVLQLAKKTTWWSDYFQQHSIITNNIRTFSDFQRIPPVNRSHFIDTPKKDLLLVNESDPTLLWRGSSGSTTGVPFVWALNKTILITHVLSNILLQLEKRGFSFKENAHRDFHLHLNMFMTREKHAFKWFSQPDFHTQPQDQNRKEKIIELHTLLQNTGTQVVLTGPNELIPLVDTFSEYGFRPHVPFFITVGSPLEEKARDLAAQYFGAQVFSFYGAQEMGPCAIECKNVQSAYHVLSDRIILEVLDEGGQPVENGASGLVTVTCLDNTVMPLIRYQPGDWGALLLHTACGCGNNLPLLKILQRTSDVIYCNDGSNLSITPLLRFFNRPPYLSIVRRFQIEQDRLNHIIVRLEVRESLPESAILRLHTNITQLFKDKFTGDIVQMPHIPQNGLKLKVFIPLKNKGDSTRGT